MPDEYLESNVVFDGDQGLGDTGLTAEQLNERPSDADLGLDPAEPQDTRPAPSQAQTIREAALAYGLDLSGQPDDHSAFVHLIQLANQNKQADYYAQLGRQIAPRYKEIQAAIARPPAAPAEPKAWEAPEFDDRWLGLVDRDEATGMWVGKPGVPQSIVDGTQKYADWMQGFQRNPMATLNPWLEDRLESLVTERLDARFAAQHARTQATSILDQHSSWLYQADEHGRRLTDKQGRYIPTPEGAKYYGHIQTLARAGVTDTALADQLARQLLAADLAAKQATAGQPPRPGTAAATRRPSTNTVQAPGNQQRRPSARPDAPSDTEGTSLADLMRAAMKEEGVTDADFQLH